MNTSSSKFTDPTLSELERHFLGVTSYCPSQLRAIIGHRLDLSQPRYLDPATPALSSCKTSQPRPAQLPDVIRSTKSTVSEFVFGFTEDINPIGAPSDDDLQTRG